MTDKITSYMMDTLNMFGEWLSADETALLFAALIVMCSLAVVFKQLVE